MVDSTITAHLSDENATLAMGSAIARVLPERALVFLVGDLGAGKTTMVRGLLRALGHQGSTKSPTYTLVEPYQLSCQLVYHFDLYRLGDPEELEYIGIRDYLEENAVCLVEWPEKGAGFLPQPDLTLNLNYEGESRSITLESSHKGWLEAIESGWQEMSNIIDSATPAPIKI